MSRPAPLEAYITRSEFGRHYAQLYDPANQRVLFACNGPTHEEALDRLMTCKRHSKVARRRHVLKSSRPPMVLALLSVIHASEETIDADDDAQCTFVRQPRDQFVMHIRNAIAAIEGEAP